MINVIASIKVKEGRLSDLLDIFKSNVPNVLEEKGCIEYAATIDIPTGLPPQQLEGNTITVLEKWESVEDLKTHLASPHMAAYFEKTENMVENTTIKVLQQA